MMLLFAEDEESWVIILIARCEALLDRSFEIEQIIFAESSKDICSLEVFLKSSDRSRFRIVNSIKLRRNIGTYIAFHVVFADYKSMCCSVLSRQKRRRRRRKRRKKVNVRALLRRYNLNHIVTLTTFLVQLLLYMITSLLTTSDLRWVDQKIRWLSVYANRKSMTEHVYEWLRNQTKKRDRKTRMTHWTKKRVRKIRMIHWSNKEMRS
jgi:hypothetical protein